LLSCYLGTTMFRVVFLMITFVSSHGWPSVKVIWSQGVKVIWLTLLMRRAASRARLSWRDHFKSRGYALGKRWQAERSGYSGNCHGEAESLSATIACVFTNVTSTVEHLDDFRPRFDGGAPGMRILAICFHPQALTTPGRRRASTGKPSFEGAPLQAAGTVGRARADESPRRCAGVRPRHRRVRSHRQPVCQVDQRVRRLARFVIRTRPL
jgi:hypothetical protein